MAICQGHRNYLMFYITKHLFFFLVAVVVCVMIRPGLQTGTNRYYVSMTPLSVYRPDESVACHAHLNKCNTKTKRRSKAFGFWAR